MFGVGEIGKTVASVVGSLNLPGGMLSALGQISVADQQKAFIAVLTATSANAAGKQSFNLETEINDLWVRLNNLKQAGSPSGSLADLQGVMSSQGAAMNILSGVSTQLSNVLQSLIKNMP